MGHLPQHVVERLQGDASKFTICSDNVSVEQQGNKQCIVVEHLLEMWHQPLLVDTVSMESSAQVIVDPTTNHAPKRVCHHLERLGVACVVPDAQQQRKTVSVRELGSRAEAAIHAVVIGCQLARRFGQQAAVECPPRHKRVGILLEEICQSLGLGFNLAALGGVVIGNRLQNPTKSRPAVTIVRREIGAAIEGPQVQG
jgi:hypothetical protein